MIDQDKQLHELCGHILNVWKAELERFNDIGYIYAIQIKQQVRFVGSTWTV